MQPPETEPMALPSSRNAIIEPTGRGDEPQVRTTVASKARWPALRQSCKALSTMTSMLSIDRFLRLTYLFAVWRQAGQAARCMNPRCLAG